MSWDQFQQNHGRMGLRSTWPWTHSTKTNMILNLKPSTGPYKMSQGATGRGSCRAWSYGCMVMLNFKWSAQNWYVNLPSLYWMMFSGGNWLIPLLACSQSQTRLTMNMIYNDYKNLYVHTTIFIMAFIIFTYELIRSKYNLSYNSKVEKLKNLKIKSLSSNKIIL